MHVLHLQFIHRWKKNIFKVFFLSNGDVQQPPSVFFGDFPGNHTMSPRCCSRNAWAARLPSGNPVSTMGIQLVSWWPGGLSHPLEKKTDAQVSHWIISPSFRANNFSKQNNFETTIAPLKSLTAPAPKKKKKSYLSGPNKKERDPSSNPTATILLGIFWPGWPWHFLGKFPHEKKTTFPYSFIDWKIPFIFSGARQKMNIFSCEINLQGII